MHCCFFGRVVFDGDCTDFVSSLPLEGDLAQAHVHDVVVGLGRVADLADNVTLLHDGVALLLQHPNGAPHPFHGARPCRRVYGTPERTNRAEGETEMNGK